MMGTASEVTGASPPILNIIAKLPEINAINRMVAITIKVLD